MFSVAHKPFFLAVLASALLAAPAGAMTMTDHPTGGRVVTSKRSLAAASVPSSTAAPSAMSALESQVLADVNSIRRTHGLRPLRLSTRLSAAASSQSGAMGRKGFFSHDSADGTAFWKRIARYYKSSGYRFWSVGENLLWASPDVDGATALKMWMNSPEHRANLLSRSWHEIGISAVHVQHAPGAYGGQDVTIVTTDFGVRR